VRKPDGLRRGDLIGLAEPQRAVPAELVAVRARDRAEIAAPRAATRRLAVELAELRAERETARATSAAPRAAHERLRARVLERAGELAQPKEGGPRGMPGLEPDEPAATAEARPDRGDRAPPHSLQAERTVPRRTPPP
jgi:hypothetical protein